MNDYVTCHGCGGNVYSDLAIKKGDVWFCSKKCADGHLPLTTDPTTFTATVRKVNNGGYLKGSFGKITSKRFGSLIDHDLKITYEDLGITKKRHYRKPDVIDVTIDYLDEHQGEDINHTELFNRIYEETGKVLKDDEMQAVIEDARKTIASWRKEK